MKKKNSTTRSKAMKAAWKRRKAKLALEEVIKPGKSKLKMNADGLFEIKDGLPATRRLMVEPEIYEKIKNTLTLLEPKKKHFLIDPKLKTRILGIAAREFPKYKIRTSLTPDKKAVAIWREI